MARATFVLCAVPTAAAACSKSTVYAMAEPTMAFLLARAGTDTVRTGPGSVTFRVAAGHAGPAVDREIFGLTMEVERIAGPARADMPAGTTRVILVPWDYGADCRPTPFAGSVRWVQEGRRGVYAAVLRPRPEWVGGVPTLDSFSPMSEPYVPGPGARRDAMTASPDSTLGLAEMMDLSDLLPGFYDIRRDPVAATRPVYDWVRANPTRARRAPVPEIVSTLRIHQLGASLSEVRHPAVGTYRLTLELAGRPLATLFARTVPTPTSGEYRRRRTIRIDPIDLPPYDVYSFEVHIATTADSLPDDCTRTVPTPRGGYFTMLPDAPVESTAGRRYPVNVELDLFSRASPADGALREIARQAFESYYARSQRNEPVLMIGAVLIAPDGTALLSQAETLPDGRRVTVRGARVSTAVVRCDR